MHGSSRVGRLITVGAFFAPIVVFLVAVVVPDHRGNGSYYASARLLLHGRAGPEWYDDSWMRREVEAATEGRVSDLFVPNPPTMSLMAVPVAWLPPSAARRAWDAINVTVLLITLACLVRANRGPVHAVPTGKRLRSEAPWLLVVVFSLLGDPVVEGFRLGQAYILLLGLHALAWWGVGRGRPGVVGAGLALALMTKASAVPLWLLLLARGAWSALSRGLAGCVLIGALTLPWLGVDVWRTYLVDVVPRAIGNPAGAVTAYQSLPGFWAHLFRFDARWNPAPIADAPAIATALTLASTVAVLALTLAVTRRSPLPLAFGAMAAASVFVLPFAEQHHYTLAVLPACVAVGEWVQRAKPDARGAGVRAAGVALLAAGLLIGWPLPYEAEPLSRGALALLAYPRLGGGLLLWGVLLWFSGSASSGSAAVPPRAIPRDQGGRGAP